MNRFIRIVPLFAALGAITFTATADAREPERLHLSGSHWDGSGTLQLVHPTSISRGAGYAGGIMSAAIDGARSAHALLEYGIGGGDRV